MTFKSIDLYFMERKMKPFAYLLLAPMFLLGCQTTTQHTKDTAQRIELQQPQAQSLCDQYICANAQGISKDLTVKYLGQAQADKVFSQGTFDQAQFTFANGIFCDTKVRKCFVDRYFDANGQRSAEAKHYSQALFGQ